MKSWKTALAGLGLFALPFLASAHEVYVLNQGEIHKDLTDGRFTWWSVIANDPHRFMFWASIGIFIVLLIFGISIMRPVERFLDPLFDKVKKYALHITRITVGVAFLAGAYYAAAYGPELPLVNTWGAYAPLLQVVLAALGLMLVFGVFVRLAALVALVLFAINVWFQGSYMLTYTNYLGEIIVLLLMGTHGLSGHHTRMEKGGLKERLAHVAHKVQPYAMLIIRVGFGISLLYAAYYAKFLHDDLALDVASGNGILPTIMTHAKTVAGYLGFEPHFLVVGAGIVEFVIAIFFILGIEIRFTALFLEFWLALSLWYFGEAVWPHFILIGIPIAFFFYGYDKYSLEGRFFKKRKMEPVF